MKTIKRFSKSAINSVIEGGIIVMPTDTMYGVSCRVDNIASVERVYELRKRNPLKPYIVLISDVNDLKKLKISVSQKTLSVLKKLWPNPITIVLPCHIKEMKYLHRGTNTIALRMPANRTIKNFLKKTGPLISTSANWEGCPPAQNIQQAKKYFGDKVDLYIDRGKLSTIPSTIIGINREKIEILREGIIKLSELKALLDKPQSL